MSGNSYSRELGVNFVYYKMDPILLDIMNDLNVDQIINEQYDTLVERLTNKNILVISHLWESLDPTLWKTAFEQLIIRLKKKHPNLKIIQFANSWYREQDTELPGIDAKYYFDFFILRIYYKILVEKVSTPPAAWNGHAEKFLFLTGLPDRFNRIRLLHKVIQEGLVDRLVWSFNCQNPEMIEGCASFVNELTLDEVKEFISKYTNFPDKFFSKTGIPYDSDLYENKLFQLVSESYFERPWISPHWTSEKTWLPIVNRLPFLIAGEYKTMEGLNRMGFRTFQEYLLIPNYDNPDKDDYLHYRKDYSSQGFFQNPAEKKHWADFYQVIKGPDWPDTLDFSEIHTLPQEWQDEINNSYHASIQYDPELRTDAIVQNVKYLLDNISKYRDAIREDVEFNYNHFVKLGQKNLKLLADIESSQGLDDGFRWHLFDRGLPTEIIIRKEIK